MEMLSSGSLLQMEAAKFKHALPLNFSKNREPIKLEVEMKKNKFVYVV